MLRRHVVGFVMIPLVLVFTGWLFGAAELWGSRANASLSWLCTAVALAVLLLGVVCLVSQTPPNLIPTRVLLRGAVGTLVLVGAWMLVDRGRGAGAGLATVADWVGFAVVVSGVFALSRTTPRPGP